MTDADRTDKAEERENMYIMMFTLQSLQNYGLSVKKTVERSLILFIKCKSHIYIRLHMLLCQQKIPFFP